jgi:hypothetical protein
VNHHRFIPTLQALMRTKGRTFVSLEIAEQEDVFKTGEIEFGLLLGF